MRRLVLIACLAALAVAAQATTASAFVAGIGDQNASTFSDPNFQALHVKRTRLIIAWDAILSPEGRARIDEWMNAARAAKLKPVVAFNASAGSACPNRPCKIPSTNAYKRAFLRFRKRYRFVREYNFWNETNSATQPTGPTKRRTIKKAALLYRAALRVCKRKCRVSGPDLLDQGVGDRRRSVRVRNQKRMLKWVRLFLRYAGRKNYPKIWGIHNYGDTNYRRSTGTKFMLGKVAKRGQVWVTETGGIYEFTTQDGRRVFKPSESRQARATSTAYKIAKKYSRRIKRLYYYQWRKNNVFDLFDAGIVDPVGAPRKAYTVLKRLPRKIWR